MAFTPATQKLPERLEAIAELTQTASGKVQKYVVRELVSSMSSTGAVVSE